jgi:hypothetical protein
LLDASFVAEAMAPQAVGVNVQRKLAGKVFNELELSQAIPYVSSDKMTQKLLR